MLKNINIKAVIGILLLSIFLSEIINPLKTSFSFMVPGAIITSGPTLLKIFLIGTSTP